MIDNQIRTQAIEHIRTSLSTKPKRVTRYQDSSAWDGFKEVVTGKRFKKMGLDELGDMGVTMRDTPSSFKICKNAGTANWNPHTNTIHLPDVRRFTNPITFLEIFIHELAHATAHPSMMGRKRWDEIQDSLISGGKNRLIEEIVAETAAHIILKGIVGENGEFTSAAFIKDFTLLYKTLPGRGITEKDFDFISEEVARIVDYLGERIEVDQERLARAFKKPH